MKIFKFIGKLIGIVLALFVVVIIIGVVVDDDESKSTTTTKTVKTKKVEGPVYTRENPNPITDFGYEFTEDGKALKLVRYKGTSSSIIFPETIEGYPVIEIDSCYLSKDNNPYYIYIPKNIKRIRGSCFSDVKGNIEIEDLQNISIELDYCFYNSDLSGTLVLTDVMVKEYNKDSTGDILIHRYGQFARTKITKLVVKEGVKRINAGMFQGCENLTSITLPKSLKYIEEWAFNDCKSLTEVNIPEGKKIYYINSTAFKGDTALSLETRKKLFNYGYEGTFDSY